MAKLKSDFKKSARPHHPPQAHIAAYHRAAASDDLETVLAFLAQYPDAVDVKDQSAKKYDITALQLASRHGHVRIMKALRDAGSNLNQQNGMGTTPLMAATLKDHAPAVQFLLQSGVDTKIRNSAGWDAERCAKENLGVNPRTNKKAEIIGMIKESRKIQKEHAAALRTQLSPA